MWGCISSPRWRSFSTFCVQAIFSSTSVPIGSYTVLATAAVGAGCISFEPGAEAFKWLRLNIALDGVADRVEARRREAAGGSCDVVAFTSGQDTVSYVVRQGREGSTRSISMTTLDRALGADHGAGGITLWF
jgi:hypothetical protein